MLFDKLKESKLYIGIALVVQSVSFLALFLISYNKRREESGAFLAMGAVFGIVGAYLLALERLEDDNIYGDFSRHFNNDFDFDDDSYDGDSDIEDDVVKDAKQEKAKDEQIEIPVDETADESEFN